MKLNESIGMVFSRLYRARIDIISNKLKHLNLTSNESIHLMNIHRHPGLNQGELSNILSTDKATVSKTLRTLENRGYVKKSLDENDRRYYKLYLSEDGELLILEIRQILEQLWLEDLDGVSIDEQEFFLNILNKIFINVEKKLLR